MHHSSLVPHRAHSLSLVAKRNLRETLNLCTPAQVEHKLHKDGNPASLGRLSNDISSVAVFALFHTHCPDIFCNSIM